MSTTTGPRFADYYPMLSCMAMPQYIGRRCNLAPEQGLEPWTRGFGDRCSTTELHRRKLFITTDLVQVSITPDLRLLPPAAHDAMLWHIERRYNSGVGKGSDPYLSCNLRLPGDPSHN